MHMWRCHFKYAVIGQQPDCIFEQEMVTEKPESNEDVAGHSCVLQKHMGPISNQL